MMVVFYVYLFIFYGFVVGDMGYEVESAKSIRRTQSNAGDTSSTSSTAGEDDQVEVSSYLPRARADVKYPFQTSKRIVEKDSPTFTRSNIDNVTSTQTKDNKQIPLPNGVSSEDSTNFIVKDNIEYDFNSMSYYQDQKKWLESHEVDLKEPIRSRIAGPVALSMEGNQAVTKVLDSKAAVIYEYVKIFQEVGQKDEIKLAIVSLIDKQNKNNIINWATPYQLKAEGQMLYQNIEFDHIPPKTATPSNIIDDDSMNLFQNQAPTLAISNFDHRSELWKQCSTPGTDAPIMKKYKEYVGNRDYMCAIFANLYCLKERENAMDVRYRVHPVSAFDRYKNGFKSLVNLHYDFGSKFNPLLQKPKELTTSAYCEVASKQTKCVKHDEQEGRVFFGISGNGEKMRYYCQNYLGCSKTCGDSCKYQERNLRISERNLLQNWLGSEPEKSVNEEKFLFSTCFGKDLKVWTDLFS